MTRPSAPDTSTIASPREFVAAFLCSPEALANLETYATLLRHWQATINLVAPSTLDHIWQRHFADSAQLIDVARQASSLPTPAPSPQRGGEKLLKWLDLGSGAGFPGMVVAIMMPCAHVTLIESDQRKAAFLREVARRTGTAVDILSIRIEVAATQARLARPHVISARALAPLGTLLELAAPFFASGTVAVFPKGREVEREVEDARRNWAFDSELRPSRTDAAGRIVVVRNLRPLEGA